MTDEQKNKLDEYSNECLKESNVEETVLKKAEKGVYSDDPKLKIHAYCVSKKINLQNGRGELQRQHIKEKLMKQMKDENEIETILQMCLIQKENAEDTAFESIKCLHKNLPENVSLV